MKREIDTLNTVLTEMRDNTDATSPMLVNWADEIEEAVYNLIRNGIARAALVAIGSLVIGLALGMFAGMHLGR